MAPARYRIRRKTDLAFTEHGHHADGRPFEPYGLWDVQEHQWVDKFGQPSLSYWACCREVALMRRRDLTQYAKEADR